MRRLLAVGLLLGAPACGEATRPAPAPARANSGKAELFADAALVPTRAGEHARRELAVEAELSAIIEMLPGVHASVVTVALPPVPGYGRRPQDNRAPRAMVAVNVASDVDSEALREQLDALARGWLAPGAQTQVLIAQTPAPEPTRPRPWTMIALALLGLGASVGVTVDRALDRRRSATAASRRRTAPRA